MTQVNNLDKLTDRIYQEGIQKAKDESSKILDEARKERDKIINEAQKEAENIRSKANSDADKTRQSISKELEIKKQQIISELKNEIEHLLSDRIIKTQTGDLYVDENFLRKAIFEVIDHWKKKEELEVVLPEHLAENLKKALTNSLKKELPEIEIHFNGRLTNGFRILKKPEEYLISFSEEDMINLFKSYLSQQTQKMLFDKE